MKNKYKRRGLGKEDILHKGFSNLVKRYEAFGKLNNVVDWTYLPFGEKRTATTGALLKAKGTKAGYPDFWFRKIENDFVHNIFIEYKTDDKTSKQSDTQKKFEENCVAKNERYYIARNLEEGVKILEKELLINK